MCVPIRKWFIDVYFLHIYIFVKNVIIYIYGAYIYIHIYIHDPYIGEEHDHYPLAGRHDLTRTSLRDS